MCVCRSWRLIRRPRSESSIAGRLPSDRDSSIPWARATWIHITSRCSCAPRPGRILTHPRARTQSFSVLIDCFALICVHWCVQIHLFLFQTTHGHVDNHICSVVYQLITIKHINMTLMSHQTATLKSLCTETLAGRSPTLVPSWRQRWTFWSWTWRFVSSNHNI